MVMLIVAKAMGATEVFLVPNYRPFGKLNLRIIIERQSESRDSGLRHQ